MVVEFGSEKHASNLGDVYLAQQVVGIVEYGNEAVAAAADGMHELSQFHIGRHMDVFLVDDAVETHQCQHRVVGVVGQELALAGQTHTVDAVGFEEDNREIREDADDNEGCEELVASRYLGDEEDAGQGRVHHACHHACHAQQGKILFGQERTYPVHVPQAREQETAERTDEQRRGERTAATAAAIGCRRGKDLGEKHQCDIYDEQLVVSVEERIAQDGTPFAFRGSVEQDVDARIAFAVERREHEDKAAEEQSAHDQPDIGTALQPSEDAFAEVHGADEVQTDQAAGHTQQDACRHTFDEPVLAEGKMEQRIVAHKQVGETGGGDTGDEDGQERSHREVDHQDLEGEHHACNGSFEDAGDGRRCATSHEQHQDAPVHLEELSQITADGRTREYDGSLGTHRAAEPDGNGRGDHRSPAVVCLEAALLGTDGVEDACDAVTDVVLHDISHEKGGDQNADDGEHQVQPVERIGREAVGQEQFDALDDPMEDECGHGSKESHGKTQHQGEMAVGNVPFAP